ncbi:MAG TPA: hypothetical protein VM286_02525 [Candidatus Thermoplasmatota archaeon]|nr:hypothetical protein [Candidatus Thermoplasmatota archaeon]
MRATWGPAALLAILALAAPACAAPAPVLQADVGALFLDGPSTVAGALASLHSTGTFGQDPADPAAAVTGPGETDPRLAPDTLRLSALTLHIETDQRTQDGPAAGSTAERSTLQEDAKDAVAVASPARPGFLYFVGPMEGHPLPTVRIDAPHLRMEAVAAAGGEPGRRVSSDRAPLSPAPGPAASLGAGVRSVHIEGDLVLALWEWDLDVTTAEGAHAVPSGYEYAATAPSVPLPSGSTVDTVGRSRERQVFIQAHGAVLDLTFPEQAAMALAVRPGSAALDGRLTVVRPEGSLATAAGPRDLRDGDWVSGTISASFAALGSSSFHLDASGDLRAASLGGLPVQVAATPAVDVQTAMVAGITIALLAGAAWALWQRRPQRSPCTDLARREAVPSDPADEGRLLEWLAAQPESRQGLLWDSDVMSAFAWTEEKAQRTLRALQRLGQLRSKDVRIAPDRCSMGAITITKAGLARLAGPVAPKAIWLVGLAAPMRLLAALLRPADPAAA